MPTLLHIGAFTKRVRRQEKIQAVSPIHRCFRRQMSPTSHGNRIPLSISILTSGRP